VVDDETQQLLAFGERQVVDAGGGTLREVRHSLAQSVAGCKLLALADETVALLSK